ncbi:MAG: RNA pseudouridine synthase, partial [Candidatus Omnitrophica bacterium]|nr:RNA pseudouridine synthase [Candidatus Omnitrophota bacterium]
KVLQRHNGVTLVALFPKTGRTHQLRVHMRYIKHPILGDSKYGKKNSFSRLALHAKSIGFKHPMTKEYVEFSSKTPDEFLTKVYGKENR